MKEPEIHSLYIIDGKVYDLKDWIPIHPGGTMWFQRSYGRDLTTIVQVYHNNQEVIKKILAKYETNIKMKADPVANVPQFLVPEGYDPIKDTQVFDFSKKDSILQEVRGILATKEWKAKVARMDFLYDLIGFLLVVFHLLMIFPGVYYEVLPAPLMVVFFVITRTSMGSMGHYHCHRAKNGITDWGDSLFDMQYVGASMVSFDGHVVGHHTQTNALIDPKRTIFTGLLELPRLYRVPAETMRRWGHALTGMTVRWFIFVFMEKGIVKYPTYKIFQYVIIRAILIAEFFFCFYTGHLGLWLAQFALAQWWNLFLIVSSHDFDLDSQRTDSTTDWATFQINISTDISVVGNPYIDSYLTAGLGCHRVHHLLPGQKSGFSNAATLPIVKKIWEERGNKWERTQHFVLDRWPIHIRRYILSPARGLNKGVIGEALSITGIFRTITWVLGGFIGQGQI